MGTAAFSGRRSAKMEKKIVHNSLERRQLGRLIN
jgi:hypothetical protein